MAKKITFLSALISCFLILPSNQSAEPANIEIKASTLADSEAEVPTAKHVEKEKIAVYEISRENFPWYLNLALFLSGYDWGKATIKTGVSSVNIFHDEEDDENSLLYLAKSSGAIKGIFKEQELTKEAAKELFIAWNFLHGEQEGNYEIKLINPIAGEDGFIHSKFRKTKSGGEYLICGQTLNKSGENNSDIEVIIDLNPEPVIIKITVTLKNNRKVILEKIKNPE